MKCPVCSKNMERRTVAPCYDCGHSPRELEEWKRGEHRYAEYEVIPGQQLILCNFCDADFGSYHPEYWGLVGEATIGQDQLKLVREIKDTALSQDWYCEECKHRLAFLTVLCAVRRAKGGEKLDGAENKPHK